MHQGEIIATAMSKGELARTQWREVSQGEALTWQATKFLLRDSIFRGTSSATLLLSFTMTDHHA